MKKIDNQNNLLKNIFKSIMVFISKYPVPIMFIIFLIFTVPMSHFTVKYLINELLTRLARNSFLVLSLLLPIMAGMGINFAMVLGAMAGQIALILITDWSIVGIPGFFLAILISLPIAILLGFFCGYILNRAKGREMVTSMILGFFMNGFYQFVVLYMMGPVIPIKNKLLLLSRGFGIRNAINLQAIRQCIDDFIPITVLKTQYDPGIKIQITTFILIAIFCLFIIWFKKTKIGQDMRAVGQDRLIAESSGIASDKTRLLSIVISTVLAAIGQIIFLQNIGTLSTYNSHDQTGQFAAASLLVGGATVSSANIGNVFLGVTLFHLMFIVSPMAGKNILGNAQVGEYFRVFVSYGIIAIALVLYSWKRHKEKERERMALRQNTIAPKTKTE
ncbi:MAG: ABC transporter permease [Exilispira sp.]|nr:ABC transporter permease [Exilispira sp.]